MDKALQTFEDLVRRSIAPSMTFFVLWGVAEMIRWHYTGSWLLDRDGSGELNPLVQSMVEAPGFFSVVVVLAIVGLSYALVAAQHVAFGGVWRNFEPKVGLTAATRSEGEALAELRREVVGRLHSEPALQRFHHLDEASDYVLYEILGGIDPTDTRPFVDSAKTLGTVFASVILLAVSYLFAYQDNLEPLWILVLVGVVVAAWWVGNEAIRSQYRRRALRLYVNFLAMPTDYLQSRLLRRDTPSAET